MSYSIKCLLDFIVLGVIYFLFCFRKWNSKGKDKLIVNTLMYAYISFVLYFTLMPILVSIPFILNHSISPMNLIPFGDLFSGRGDTVRQILLNIIMLIPFGFLLPIIKKQTIWACVLWSFLFSLGIEFSQPIINGFRSSDITDLITNTIGGTLGYLLYLLFKPLVGLIIKKLKTSNTK